MLEIINLSKAFKRVKAVDGLSITVNDGEIVGLIGPNGSGKTTTILCALTIEEWDEGKILINGLDIAKHPLKARKQLAFIPEYPDLVTGLTVWQQIEFMARVYRVKGWQDKALQMLKDFDLIEKKDENLDELSKGQGQKLQIICAFLHEPSVIFMDEPIIGMDPKGVRKLKELIFEAKRRGASILISSHYLTLLEELADKVVIIFKGRKVAEGPVATLRKDLASCKDGGLEEVYLEITKPLTEAEAKGAKDSEKDPEP